MKGCLIIFEGTEGSGKTVQAKLLEKWLKKMGYSVLYTREPTKYPIGHLIHQILEKDISATEEAIALLFAADRTNHTKRYIAPALRKGSIVLCDRYVFSSLAYQSRGMKIRLSKKWLKEINKYAIKPDVVFFLDIDPEEGLKRIVKGQRVHDDEFFENLETQQRIREAYYDVLNLNQPITNFFKFKSMPHSLLFKVKALSVVDRTPIISIDGALPQENIQDVIRAIMQRFLKHREILPRKRRVKPEELFSLLQFEEE